MKIKKEVTDRVLAANRANAKKSTGPRTKRGNQNSRNNATQHGLLARRIVFDDDEERVAFESLLQDCHDEFRPDGFVQKILVEEITTCVWKTQIALGLETQALSAGQNLRERIRGVFHGELELPLDAEAYPLDRGWDCDRVIVRSIADRDVDTSTASRGPAIVQNQLVPDYVSTQRSNSQNRGHIEVEAVLGNALANIARYGNGVKRDLYRAIELLRKMQGKSGAYEDGES